MNLNYTEKLDILINSPLFLINIGSKNIKNYTLNLKFSCVEFKDIDTILLSDNTINCDTEILNNFRDKIFKNLGMQGLKEYNFFIQKYKPEIFKNKNNIIDIFIKKGLSESSAINFMQIYLNSILEENFSEKISNFNFYSNLIDIYKEGNIVCGYQFLKNIKYKIYDIFSYPVDQYSEDVEYPYNNIVIYLY